MFSLLRTQLVALLVWVRTTLCNIKVVDILSVCMIDGTIFVERINAIDK